MTKLGEKQIAWTNNEIESLKLDWVTMAKSELVKKYNRTYYSLKTAATKLGVKRGFPRNKYRLEKLFDESNISYYWLGFIMADGNIGRDELKITLSSVDFDHLSKFAEYMGVKIKLDNEKCSVQIADRFYCEKMRGKFNTSTNKTYCGADFNIENMELFFSFLAGIIDGDGCFCTNNYKVKKVNMIRIHCHSSYMEFYKKISDQLKEYGIESRVYMCSRGYCKFVISRQKDFIKLNNYVTKCNIPLLHRKWSKLKNILH
jgi:hypothetical protein